jgi:hypothetical protein
MFFVVAHAANAVTAATRKIRRLIVIISSEMHYPSEWAQVAFHPLKF